MDPIPEPSKWVCRLASTFENGNSEISGTGFLVNIPGSEKLCILTAGHNLLNDKGISADEVSATFPDGVQFKAFPGECFVSAVYRKFPTRQSGEESSICDYGLISVSPTERGLGFNEPLGGCGFSVWRSDYDILAKPITVHGYREGKEDQAKGNASLDLVKAATIHYSIDTIGGVSGGPVITMDDSRNHVVIGIHNYHSRATRLTPRVMLEIQSWISDRPLQRTLKLYGKAPTPTYLQSTLGTLPNIVSRPNAKGSLCFLLIESPKYSPKYGKTESKPLYSILPSTATADQDEELSFLALDDKNQRVFFEKVPVPRSRNALWVRPKTKAWEICVPGSDYGLKVLHSSRRPCECGCVTQDQRVGLEKGSGSKFLM